VVPLKGHFPLGFEDHFGRGPVAGVRAAPPAGAGASWQGPERPAGGGA
jgi:hypothetical protein